MRNEYRAYLQQCKEQESLYHQIALSLGLPDSVLYLLYTIAEQGDRRRAGGPEESRPAVQRVVHLQADGALGRGVAEKTGSGDAGA